MDSTAAQQGPSGPAFGGGVYGGGGDPLRLKLREEERTAREAITTEARTTQKDPAFSGGLKSAEPEREDHGNRIRGYAGLGAMGSIPEASCNQARPMTGREMLRRKTAHLRAEGHALTEEAKSLLARAEERLREARNIDDLVALLPEFTGVAPGADQALVRLAAGL
jgi:hypothetical protein